MKLFLICLKTSWKAPWSKNDD